MRILINTTVLILIFSVNSIAQRSLPKVEKDSLWIVWSNPQEPDSNRIVSIQRIAWHGYLFSQPDSAFYFAQLYYDFAKSKDLMKQMSSALNIQGTAMNFQGDYTKAIDYYTRSMKISEDLGDKQAIGATLNNMGNIFKNQGNYTKAIDCFFKSLRLSEEVPDIKGVASSLGNIANLYMMQADYDKAIDYFSRSLTIMEELGNRQGIAGTLNNLGLIYSDKGDNNKALDHHKRSLLMREELGDRRGISDSKTNIGNVFLANGDYTQAAEYHQNSLIIREGLQDRKGVAGSLFNLGKVHATQNQHAKAIDFGNRALQLAKVVGDVTLIKDISKELYVSYKTTNRHEAALSMYELHFTLRDSILKEENQRELIRQQFQYDYEKREAELKAEQELKHAVAQEEMLRQRSERNMMGLGFMIFILVGGTAGLSLHQRRKAEYRYHSARLELTALRAQMKPHFIFNALNSIHQFIDNNNPAVAKEYLVKFSKHMRATLNNTLTDEVTVEEEVESLREYLELEKANLPGQLNYEIEIDPAIDVENTILPPLMIQPFIENAVLHGITPKKGPGTITVRMSKKDKVLHVSVIDDGIGRKNSAQQKENNGHISVGLKLTQERMEKLNRDSKVKTGIVFTDLEQGLRVDLMFPLKERF
jgi:tetratricopeptide (TPR) repeat protein